MSNDQEKITRHAKSKHTHTQLEETKQVLKQDMTGILELEECKLKTTRNNTLSVLIGKADSMPK
jgi:hypothetical protein